MRLSFQFIYNPKAYSSLLKFETHYEKFNQYKSNSSYFHNIF